MVPKKLPAVTFVKEVIMELKKVNWPTRAETIKLTLVVLLVSVLIGVFVGGLDILFVNIQQIVFK